MSYHIYWRRPFIEESTELVSIKELEENIFDTEIKEDIELENNI